MSSLVLSILGLLGVHWAAMISPGPNVFLVTQTAIAQSRKNAIWVGLGVTTGGFIWSVAAVIGIAIILIHLVWLRYALHLFGGLYLCYLAFRLWRNSMQPTTDIPFNPNNSGQSLKKSYRMGVISSLTSPKTAVYFASILPALLPAHPPVWFFPLLVTLFAISSAIWYTMLSFGMSHFNIRSLYFSKRKWIDRISGLILSTFGIRMIANVRNI